MGEKQKRIQTRLDQLHRKQTRDLKEMVERIYRVVDTRGTPKGVLIGMVMEAEFGRNWKEENVVPAITDTQRSQAQIKMTKYNTTRRGMKSG